MIAGTLCYSSLTVKTYREELESIPSEEIKEPFSILDTIDQLNTQLRPALDSLKSAYQDIFTDDGFTLKNVDVDMLNNILKVMDEMKEMDLSIDTSSFENLARILVNSSSTADEVQNAFNSLADSILTNTDVIDSLNEETATVITTMLEQMGVTNAQEIVTSALTDKTNELALSKLYLAETGEDIANASENEVDAFILEQIEAGNCGQALALLQLKKMLVNGTLLDTSTDINNVLALANAAGITSNALSQLASAKAFYDNAVTSGNAGRIDSATAQLNSLNTQIQDDIANFKPEVKFDGNSGNSGKSSASKAGKEAADAYLEAFNKELKELDDLKDQGKISEADYLNYLKQLYTKYFKDREKYLDQYEKYERQYLDGMKSLYNSALSGIGTLLGRKVSAAESGKDAAVSALEAEKEAAESTHQAQMDALDAQIKAIERQKKAYQDIIDSIQKRIDVKQKEIDKINEAAEARKKEIDFQKAQYELERMQNQRTSFLYNGDQMIYDIDTKGVRDARENVDDAKRGVEISKIQKEISRLKDQIDSYNNLIDGLDDKIELLEGQKDRIQSMMDSTTKYYEELISQTEKYWDSVIDKMNAQKDRWAELGEMADIAEAYSAVQQVFGDLGYTVDDVLNGSDVAFEDFKSKYISLLSEMNSGNQSFQDGLSYAAEVGADKMGTFSGQLQESTDKVNDFVQSISPVSEAIDGATGSMDSLSDSAGTAKDPLSSSAQSLTDINNATTGVADHLHGIADGLSDIAATTGFDLLNTDLETMAAAISDIATALGIGKEGTVDGLVSALKNLNDISLDEGIVSQFTNLKTAVDNVTSAISGDAAGNESKSSNSKSQGQNTNTSSSLTNALKDHGDVANSVLGGDEDSGEIGKFEEFKTAVDNVATSIGTESKDETKEGGSAESGNDSSLTEALKNHYSVAEEIVPAETELFNILQEVMGQAKDHINDIKTMLEDMDGKTFTVTLNVEGSGGGGMSFSTSGLVPGYATGVKNLKKPEVAWTQEQGRELIISPTKQAALTKLNPGDSIIDHEKTENLFNWAEINPSAILPSMVKFNLPDYSSLASCVSNNASMNVGDINITCPGITSQEVARQAGDAIRREFQGLYLDAYQHSHKR